MSTIIGIDLGTTFSAVARLDETGRPAIIHNTDGSNITPSVVSFGSTSALVGEEARRSLFLEPNTFGRFKRKMGTDEVYRARGATYTPTTLSALILKKLKEETEKQIGPIGEAVVTIPANFANEAREATLEAARLAGLNVRYIINEPTAAAIYYAQYSGQELKGNYAIYDFGGGTFDVSIVRVKGNDVEVLSTEGVGQLGGDDFDQKLQKLVQKKYKSISGAELEADDFTRNDAEEEKKSLTRREKVTIRVNGKNGRANIEVTRKEFEEEISSLLAQAEMLCEAAIEGANITQSDINAVVLVGGSTRVPAVQKSVAKIFGKEPVLFANPDEVVALGAALYAAYKSDKRKLNSVQQAAIERLKLSEITSKYFGTLSIGFNASKQSEELQNTILIRKGDRIPASVTESFVTRRDGQNKVDCSVTESQTPESDPRFVKIVYQDNLELPPGRPKGQEIKVTFSYDENQTMRCSFLDVASGKSAEIDLRVGTERPNTGFDINKFIVE